MFTLNSESSQLYTSSDTMNLVINALPFNYKDSIPVFFKCNKDAAYTLELAQNTYADSIYLTDLIANKTILLSDGKYSFNALKSDTTKRFILNRKKIDSTPTKLNFNDSKTLGIDIYSYGQRVYLKNRTDRAINGELLITRMSGQNLIYEKNVLLVSEIFRNVTTPGIYIVTFKEGTHKYRGKVVIF